MKSMKMLAGLVSALLLVLLVACGDSTATSTTAPAAATTAPAAATTAPAAATTAPAAATTAPATAMAGMTPGATMAATTAPVATTAPAAATTAPATTGSSAPAGKVVIASKNFTESTVTAEIYAAALENAGFTVTRKMNLGTTDVVVGAINKGDIDLFPEYTGTIVGVILKAKAVSSDPKAVYDQAAAGLAAQKLGLLDAAPMNDSNGIVVTKATADKYNLKTLSDLATHTQDLTFATIPDFVGPRSNIDGLASLQKTYGGFNFKKQVVITDINAKYTALLNGQADVGVAFTTDGVLSSKSSDGQKLVLLQDDKNNFPPYQFAPVVRQSVLDANPKIKDVLNAVSAKLTTQVTQDLNYQVDVQKQEAVDVAQAWLKQQGLIK